MTAPHPIKHDKYIYGNIHQDDLKNLPTYYYRLDDKPGMEFYNNRGPADNFLESILMF